MFVYGIARGTNDTTNGTANTLSDHLRLATGAARTALIKALTLIGKGTGLTSLTSISFEINRYTTPSTVGTGVTPRPRAASAAAAATTAAHTPTRGTTASLQLAVGCGAAGPGGWVAEDKGAEIQLEANAGALGNADLESKSGGTSLVFEYALDIEE